MLCHQHLPGERRHMFLHVVVHPHRGLRRLGAAGRLLLLPLLLLPMPVLREVQEEKQQGAEQFAYEKQAQGVMVRRRWGGRRKVE